MKTALIIGASRGLGRALVSKYVTLGWQVIGSVRQPDALADLVASSDGRVEVATLDTTDWAGVDAMATRMSGRRIDLLFVNAGISGPKTSPIGEVDANAFSEVMLVNALAPLRIIERFAALVPRTGTIAVMSSGLASIAGNETGGWEAYRMSKGALNMGMRSIVARRAAEGRAYVAAAPGWVRTQLGGEGATLTVEESVEGLVDMLSRRPTSGGLAFMSYTGTEVPW